MLSRKKLFDIAHLSYVLPCCDHPLSPYTETSACPKSSSLLRCELASCLGSPLLWYCTPFQVTSLQFVCCNSVTLPPGVSLFCHGSHRPDYQRNEAEWENITNNSWNYENQTNHLALEGRVQHEKKCRKLKFSGKLLGWLFNTLVYFFQKPMEENFYPRWPP